MINGQNEFEFELPTSKLLITFKLLTQADEKLIEQELREFIDNKFLARDSRAFRSYLDTIMPDIDLTFDLTFDDGTVIEDITIPIGVGFFWPDASI